LAARRYRSSRPTDRPTDRSIDRSIDDDGERKAVRNGKRTVESISRIAERRIAPRVFVNIGCYRRAGNAPEIGPAPCVRTIRVLYHRYRCVFRNPPSRYLRARTRARVCVHMSPTVVNTCFHLSLSLSLSVNEPAICRIYSETSTLEFFSDESAIRVSSEDALLRPSTFAFDISRLFLENRQGVGDISASIDRLLTLISIELKAIAPKMFRHVPSRRRVAPFRSAGLHSRLTLAGDSRVDRNARSSIFCLFGTRRFARRPGEIRKARKYDYRCFLFVTSKQ